MAESVFIGPFRSEMQDFIFLKRSVGYKYNSEPGILSRFDRYLAVNYPQADALSKEAVTGWCSKTMHETAANHCSRASVIRQFSKYLSSIGIRAWILPKNYYPTGQRYVPHIYTPDELRRFFAETDKCNYCSSVPYRHLIMPEFFRLLLSCGLRCSEARLLTVGDVDLEQGVLTIRDAKNHNNRLVPMPESMVSRLRKYAAQVHPFPESVDYFFPGYGNKPMTLGNIYKNFRRFKAFPGNIRTETITPLPGSCRRIKNNPPKPGIHKTSIPNRAGLLPRPCFGSSLPSAHTNLSKARFRSA